MISPEAENMKRQLLKTTTVEELKKVHRDRSNDPLFLQYGQLVSTKPMEYIELVWLGYEFLTDSPYYDA